MQPRLPGTFCAAIGALAVVLLANVSMADSDTSNQGTKLRWVSPSRISTPDADTPAKPSSGKAESYKPTSLKVKSKSTQSKSGEESPFGKWLSTEDLAKQSTKPVEVSGQDQAVETPPEEPRVARRLFRGRASVQEQQPQGRMPMPTMHPTERQVDDRRRPEDEPADEIPDPEDAVEKSDKPLEPPLQPLTRSQERLRTKIRRVLAHYYKRPLNTRDRSPWEIMHGILAYEVHSKVLRGGPQGEPVTAVGWLCFNQPCKKRTLMYINDEHELRVRVGPALQGHRGQLLAMLAQSGVSENYPMRVEGHDLTVADLIEMEKRTCFPRSELTFKLIGLMHYLPSDAKWVNEQGMEWDLPKMVQAESRMSLRDAACGGTHRLSGLTLAYKTREERGEPVDGAYLQAKRYVQRYKNHAYRMQNGDGSFSTEWFRGPGNEDSIDRKLKTTGHILEWLLYAAEERDLKSSRITRAANYLANIMYNNRTRDWEAGPLGHAIHALLVYDRLMFVPHDETDLLPMASQPSTNDSKSSQSSQSRTRTSQQRRTTSSYQRSSNQRYSNQRQASSYRNRR